MRWIWGVFFVIVWSIDGLNATRVRFGNSNLDHGRSRDSNLNLVRIQESHILQQRNESRYLPIVLWHGMGDSCCNPQSLGSVVSYIKSRVPNIYIKSIATGTTQGSDIASSYFGLADDQIARVCDDLRTDSHLHNGYIAIGFSQGGQFLRGVIQRCQHLGPRAHSLITLGSQHQGVMNIPGCWEPSFYNSTPSWACRAMQQALRLAVYSPWVQRTILQAQYFKDPNQLNTYRRKSKFLADINAESTDSDYERYEQYKTNLKSLEGRLVLFQFSNDLMVVPKESSHFGFYDGKKLIPVNETELYRRDILGLKTLDEAGKLVLAYAPGFHMQFSLDWFFQRVIRQFALIASHPHIPTR